MPDITVKHQGEFSSWENGGQFNYAGRDLGVTAWGMNLLKLPPHWDKYPDHNHEADGQEEVYVVLEGSAKLEADGQTWNLTPGTFVRAGAQQKRKIIPGENGVTILALGGTPGKAYEQRK